MGAEVHPARMYATKGEIEGYGVYLEKVAWFRDVYFEPKQRQSLLDHQAMKEGPRICHLTPRGDNEMLTPQDERSTTFPGGAMTKLQFLSHRTSRLVFSRKWTIALLIAGAISMNSRRSNAQIETAGAVVGAIKTIYDGCISAYNAYEYLTYGSPPTTAQLIADAVTTITNLQTDIASVNAAKDAAAAIRDYQYALAATNQTAQAAWQKFDQDAFAALGEIAGLIDSAADKNSNFSFNLGGLYNILLPIYLQAHAKAGQWAIPTIYGVSLLDDLEKIGSEAFQRNYKNGWRIDLAGWCARQQVVQLGLPLINWPEQLD